MPAARSRLQVRLNRFVRLCNRPLACASLSTNDCTPRLTRFTPAATIASRVASASCPGAHSMVISASASRSNSARRPQRARSRSGSPAATAFPRPDTPYPRAAGAPLPSLGPGFCRSSQVLDQPLDIALVIRRRITRRREVAIGALRPAKGDGNVDSQRVGAVAGHRKDCFTCVGHPPHRFLRKIALPCLMQS
jgi:hypothetical protein